MQITATVLSRKALKLMQVSSKITEKRQLEFFMDSRGHVVCLPYSIENLHKMAKVLSLNKFSFKKDRYVLPDYKIELARIVSHTVKPATIETIITKNKL